MEYKIAEEVKASLIRLDNWIDKNGWAGYDPYDIKGHPWVLKLLRDRNCNRASRLITGGLLLSTEFFPQAFRRLLKIQKQTNAEAIGLFASAYLTLYQHFKTNTFLIKAYECLRWLEQNQIGGSAGISWGLPFDWQSLIFIPRRTPVSTVTATCGDAFLNFYKFTGDTKYLDICQNIGEFFLGSLNIDHVNTNEVCFSYTPIDRFHVHNANLLVAAFLIKVGRELHKEEFYQNGIKALNYSLAAQNKDGSFYYWALTEKDIYDIPDSNLKNIDHYHTGFVLRSLYSIYKSTGDKRVLEALSKGYEFYRDRLFEDKTVPKLKPDFTYPINIHSCAEAILCMCTLSDIFTDALQHAENAALWTKENMQTKEGWFIYTILNIKGFKYRVKIPYIRWAQAWMIRSLGDLMSILFAGSHK